MSRRLKIGPAILLLIAAVATMVFWVREYRRDRDASTIVYTRSVKKHDIVDAARNALAALTDAEIREQNYVLTGETVYSEAYADDIRAWQDERAALELVAKNDPATPIVQDFSKAGTRTLSELVLALSLYDRNRRNAGLERIRRRSGIVYLDQTRNSVRKIVEVDGGSSEFSNQFVTGPLMLEIRRRRVDIIVQRT